MSEFRLFRQEALDARLGRAMSTSVLPSEFPAIVATLAAVAVVIGMVGIVTLGHYTKRVTTTGVVVPKFGTVRIMSRSAGAVVVKSYVTEGQRVRKGETLLVLADERSGSSSRLEPTSSNSRLGSDDLVASLRKRETRIASSARLQTQLSERALAEAEVQHRHTQEELVHIDREILLQERRVQLAEEQHARQLSLAAQGYVTEGFLTAAKSDLLEQQSRLEQLRRSKLSLSRELSRLADGRAQLLLSHEKDLQQLQQASDELQQQRIEREIDRTILVVAPDDGVITNLLVTVGQVAGVRTLATLIPSSSTLEAEVNLSSREAGQVVPGQSVRLRYAAFPYQRFGQYTGHVRQVAQSGINASERADDAEPNAASPQEKFYRVRIALDQDAVQLPDGNASKRLSAGDRFEADIAVERLTVLEWLLQPLKGFRNRFSTVVPEAAASAPKGSAS